MSVPQSYAEFYTWVAHYDDDSTLAEFDTDGQKHAFAEVALDRLVAVEILGRYDYLANHAVVIDQTSSMRPVFFRRRQQETILALDPDQPRLEQTSADEPVGIPLVTISDAWVTCLGWQKTLRIEVETPFGTRIEERNIAAYGWFFDDGSSMFTDDRDAPMVQAALQHKVYMRAQELVAQGHLSPEALGTIARPDPAIASEATLT